MAKVKNKKKKDKKSGDLLENPAILAERLTKTEQFLEKNRKIVIGLIGALAVIVSGYFLVRYYLSNQNTQAQVDMFQAVYYFEADSLNKALNGDGLNYGFLDIIDNYSLTKTANLAHYYAGASYLKMGDYDAAIDHLNKFSSDDIAVQPRAFCLLGDAYMEKEDYNQAVNFYEKAANYKPNQYLSPMYLTKAALAYEKLSNYSSASDCYATIIDKYPESSAYNEARKQKARVDGLASK